MVCLLLNDGIKIRILGTHVAVEVYYLFVLFIFQESIGESGLVNQNIN